MRITRGWRLLSIARFVPRRFRFEILPVSRRAAAISGNTFQLPTLLFHALILIPISHKIVA